MRDRLLVGIQSWLDIAFSKDPSGMSFNLATVDLPSCDELDVPLTLRVDDDEEHALRGAGETKAILGGVAAAVWLVGCLRVRDACAAKPKSKPRSSKIWLLFCSSHSNFRFC